MALRGLFEFKARSAEWARKWEWDGPPPRTAALLYLLAGCLAQAFLVRAPGAWGALVVLLWAPAGVAAGAAALLLVCLWGRAAGAAAGFARRARPLPGRCAFALGYAWARVASAAKGKKPFAPRGARP